MIAYDTQSWCDILLRWEGTVFQNIFLKVVMVFLYNVGAFCLATYLDQDFAKGSAEKGAVLGSCLSFLLVFRANVAYRRYWEGRTFMSLFFTDVRDLVMVVSTFFRGGLGTYTWTRKCGEDGFSIERKSCLDDADDRRAADGRTDMVRWAVALAVSFRIHMRICTAGYSFGSISKYTKWTLDFDRMRLRGLMSAAEFKRLDEHLGVHDTPEDRNFFWSAGTAQPGIFHKHEAHPYASVPHAFDVDSHPRSRPMHVILCIFVRNMYSHMNDPHGYKERFFPIMSDLCSELARTMDRTTQSMSTPLPLPYVHLCKFLLMAYLLSIPFWLEHELGWYAGVVMPTLTAIALLGIDQIGSELENPFGEDPNDLDVQDHVLTLEREMMRMLELSGDMISKSRFVWLPAPHYLQFETNKPYGWYLALRQEVATLDIPKRPGDVGTWMKHGAGVEYVFK